MSDWVKDFQHFQMSMKSTLHQFATNIADKQSPWHQKWIVQEIKHPIPKSNFLSPLPPNNKTPSMSNNEK